MRVALVYDGYLTVEGERNDAIFFQAQVAGAPTSDLFAQRYRHRGDAVVEIGNAKHVAIAEPPLLASSALEADRPHPVGSATPAPAPRRSLLGRLRRH